MKSKPEIDTQTLTHYEILHVAKDANERQIVVAYKELALKHHPDKGGDAEEFKKINEAKQILCDADKRKEYDLRLASLASIELASLASIEKVKTLCEQDYIKVLLGSKKAAKYLEELNNPSASLLELIALSQQIKSDVDKNIQDVKPYLADADRKRAVLKLFSYLDRKDACQEPEIAQLIGKDKADEYSQALADTSSYSLVELVDRNSRILKDLNQKLCELQPYMPKERKRLINPIF